MLIGTHIKNVYGMYIMLIGTHIKNVHVYYVDRNTY